MLFKLMELSDIHTALANNFLHSGILEICSMHKWCSRKNDRDTLIMGLTLDVDCQEELNCTARHNFSLRPLDYYMSKHCTLVLLLPA